MDGAHSALVSQTWHGGCYHHQPLLFLPTLCNLSYLSGNMLGLRIKEKNVMTEKYHSKFSRGHAPLGCMTKILMELVTIVKGDDLGQHLLHVFYQIMSL